MGGLLIKKNRSLGVLPPGQGVSEHAALDRGPGRLREEEAGAGRERCMFFTMFAPPPLLSGDCCRETAVGSHAVIYRFGVELAHFRVLDRF